MMASTSEGMRVEADIDWLAATYNQGDLQRRLPFFLLSERHFDAGSSRFYPVVRRYECGAMVSYGRTEQQGAQVQFGGTAIRNVRRTYGLDALSILQNVRSNSRKVSRIDVYADVHNGELDIELLARQSVLDEYLVSSAKSSRYIREGNEGGEGLYIGTRRSKRFVRIYDKGFEMNLDNYRKGSHLRIELQNNQQHARRVAAMLTDGDSGISMIPIIINSFAHFDMEAWRVPMGQVAVSPPPLRGEESSDKRWEWLSKTVAPSIARYVHEFPESAHELNRIISEHLRSLGSDVEG